MLFKNCLSTFITCHLFHYLLFLTSSTTVHTFKLCLLIFFFFSHVFASFFGGGEQMHGFCNYQDVLTVSMLS